MHIEPGILLSQKVFSANIVALSLLGTNLSYNVTSNKALLLLIQTILASLFFCLFMQIFHVKVGYSELHFIGASLIYFTFGFTPIFFGFAFGLLLQGMLFEPQDLYHLGVNSLSLILPLIFAHYSFGRKLSEGDEFKPQTMNSLKQVLVFDAIFHSGVVLMVGFWLLLGEEAVMIATWGQFAISYVPVVLLDSVFAWTLLKLFYYLTSCNSYLVNSSANNRDKFINLLQKLILLTVIVITGKKYKEKA